MYNPSYSGVVSAVVEYPSDLIEKETSGRVPKGVLRPEVEVSTGKRR